MQAIVPPAPADVQRDVQRALAEDIGSGDVTAQLLATDARASARVITREAGVLAGQAWFDACFRALDADMRIAWNFADGARIAANDTLCTLQGNARALVGAERCALNWGQAR